MKRYLVSFLIGLISLAGMYTGVYNHLNQDDIKPIETEKHVAVDNSSQEETETETEEIETETEEIETDSLGKNGKKNNSKVVNDDIVRNNQETEEAAKVNSNSKVNNKDRNLKIDETSPTRDQVAIQKETEKAKPKKTTKKIEKKQDESKKQEKETKTIDKIVKVGSKEKLRTLYKELNSLDSNIIYKKVIIKGKEYTNLSSHLILKDIIDTYGVDLVQLDNTKASEEEASESKKLTKEKVQETDPTKTQAPESVKETEIAKPSKAPQSHKPSYAAKVLELVNLERSKKGLSTLTTESKLTDAANTRAVEIVDKFSHTRPNGESCFTVFDEYGIYPQAGGENIAYGQKSPEQVVKAWMDSDGHRANILNGKFNKLGVGVHENNGIIYWTQMFTN